MPGILATRGLGDTNPLILVVEDDPLQQSLVRNALEQHGYRTDVAGDGLSAVQRLRTGQYRLALVDYHLPQVDGVEAARLLREVMGAGRRPRLIAVTGDVDTVRERTESEGIFDAMMQKPLRLGALLALVDDHLRAADQEVLARRTTAASAIRRGLRRILC
jgi:CheY-like chemotaxis protein